MCCQWWSHQIYTSQKIHSLVRKRQIKKYFCKCCAVGLEPRNHVGLGTRGIPRVGEWGGAVVQGYRPWTGWGGGRGRSILGREQSTQSTMHSRLYLSKLMTQGIWQKEWQEMWKTDELFVSCWRVWTFSWEVRRHVALNKEEIWSHFHLRKVIVATSRRVWDS